MCSGVLMCVLFSSEITWDCILMAIDNSENEISVLSTQTPTLCSMVWCVCVCVFSKVAVCVQSDKR